MGSSQLLQTEGRPSRGVSREKWPHHTQGPPLPQPLSPSDRLFGSAALNSAGTLTLPDLSADRSGFLKQRVRSWVPQTGFCRPVGCQR